MPDASEDRLSVLLEPLCEGHRRGQGGKGLLEGRPVITAILLTIFLPFVDRCGSPQFWVRERAMEILAATWPLSEPALRTGRSSPDMEVQRRCERATPKNWWQDLAAAGVLTHRFERDGIPYADYKRVPPHGSEWFRQACIRYAKALDIDTSDAYYFGDSQFWSHPTGFDRIRMTVHGCWPADADWCQGQAAWMPELMRSEWSRIKGAK